MTLNFPFVYANGDSYTDENYLPILKGKTYVNYVADFCNGFAQNKAISGSCNRRIIRTTMHDMLAHRQLHPAQKTIVLLGLSFELRSEVWIDELENTRGPEESQLRTHVFSSQLNWRENLLDGKSISAPDIPKTSIDRKFLEKYSEGRAYFYSPYAERINLLCDLIMLRSLLESLNVDFIVFQSPIAESLQSDYLLDFFKEQISNDSRFLDFEKFSFVNWCGEMDFEPLDLPDRRELSHYGPDAHKAFAEQILIPRLQELKVL